METLGEAEQPPAGSFVNDRLPETQIPAPAVPGRRGNYAPGWRRHSSKPIEGEPLSRREPEVTRRPADLPHTKIHAYLAGIGHFYLAATASVFRLAHWCAMIDNWNRGVPGR